MKPVSYVTFAGKRSIGKGQLLTGVSAAALALVLGMSAAGAQSVTGTGDIEPILPAPPLASWDLGFGNLIVGNTTTSTLTIAGGGTVSAGSGYVGFASEGTVTVTGAGSTWTNANELVIGNNGKGTLTIADGGSVSADSAYVGFLGGSEGSATVTGAGSALTSSSVLSVGHQGKGTMTIEAGGKASGASGSIGLNVGSEGTVTVTGADSTWTNSLGLNIGENGTGSLTIADGGSVSAANAHVGFLGGSEGSATVTGTGSTWTNSSSLSIGENGTGSLTIEAGGTVKAALTNIASGPTGTGTLHLLGDAATGRGVLETGQVIKGTGTATLDLNGGILRATGAQSDYLSGFATLALGANGVQFDSNGFAIGVSTDFSGTGGLTKLGAGTLTLTGDNNYTGGTTIEAGTLALGTIISLPTTGTVSLSGAGTALDISGAGGSPLIGALSGIAGSTVVLGSRTLGFGDATNASFAGAFTGAGSIYKFGSGTQTLTGESTYDGTTTVSAGTLVAGSSQALGSSVGRTTVSDGATLSLASGVSIADALSIRGSGVGSNGALVVNTGSATLSGSVALTADARVNVGSGATLTIDGSLSGSYILSRNAGTGTLVLNGNNSAAGTSLNIAEGVLVITDQTNLPAGTLTLNTENTASAGLRVTGDNVTLNKNITLGFSGGRITSDNTVTISGNISGGSASSNNKILTKAGAGKLILTGTNTYVSSAVGSGTQVLGGTLSITNGTNIGSSAVLLNGGGLEITGSGATLSNAITLQSNASIATGPSNAVDLGGVISGVGRLTKDGAGTLTLTGANTYGGGTVINAGTLALGAGGSLVTTGAVNLAASGATFDISGASTSQTIGALSGVAGSSVVLGGRGLTFGDASSQTFAGSISGTNGITKRGSGTQTLSGASSYSGLTTITAGVLEISNDAALGDAIVGTSVSSGTTLRLTGGIAVGTEILSLQGTGAAGATGALQSASGANSHAGAITLVASSTIAVDAGTLTLSGSMSGNTNTLTVAGAGTLILAGSAAAAQTNIASGATLQIGAGGATGSISGAIVNDGTLAFNRSGAVTFGGAISGTGKVGVGGGGTAILTGANTYTGGSWASGGTLQIGDGGTTGSIVGDVVTEYNGVAGTLAFNRSGAVTFAGVISGSGTLTKLGTGTLTLTGANTHTGGTTITAGTLALGAGGSLAATGAVTLGNSGSSFDMSGAGANQTIGALSGVANSSVALGANTLSLGDANNSSFAGVISGTGGLIKQGSGTQTLTGQNTYRGGTTINAGTLALGAGGSLAASGSVTLAYAGAGFDISGAGANQTIGALSGVAGSTVALGANTLTSTNITAQSFGGSIAGTGGLTKEGSATLTLTGANTYTGTTTIDNGTLALGGGGSLAATGAVNISGAGAAFDISGAGANQTIGALSGRLDSILSLGANTLTFGDATDQAFRGDISGTGGLVKQGSGTQILNGFNNSYTGVTAINAGTLRVESSLASASVTVASGATLGGSSAITGAVTVLDGGILAPGSSPGTLTVGSLVLNDASRLSYELGTPGTVGGGVNDLVAVNGSLTLDGVLDITAQFGFGTGIYRLFDYSAGSLTDNVLNLGIVPTGYDFSIDTATGGQVNLVASVISLQFWNGAQTEADGTIHGGSETWGTGTTNWTNASGSQAFAWGDQTAVFAGAASGTVVLASNQQIAGLQFGTDGYVLNGPGALVVSAADTGMRIDTGLSATINAAIQGAGGLVKTGGGTIVLGGSNSYTGGTKINAGTLSISSDANLGDSTGGLTFNGGTLATTADLGLFRAVTLAGAGSVDVAASTQLTLGGMVSGSGSLTKLGAGTLVLSAANAHSGGTIVSAGVLRADNVAALGTGALTLDGGTFRVGMSAGSELANAVRIGAGGGTIDANGRLVRLLGDITDGGGAGGTLAVVNGAGSTGYVGLGGTNSYAGATSVGTGAVLGALSDGAFSPNSDMTVELGGILGANGQATTVRSLSGAGVVINGNSAAAGSLTIALPSGTASFSGTITDTALGAPALALALVKSGAGTQILTGENSYTGGTTIGGGRLQIGDGGTTGSIVGGVANDGTLAFNRSDEVSFGGAISGTGSLAHLGAGTLMLTGTNSFTGGTTIASGTLKVGDGGTSGSLVGDVVNNGTLAFNRSDALSFAGSISGSGSLVNQGGGTLTLAGVNSYSGGTKIASGTLTGSAASFGSGTILNNGALVVDQATLATFANSIDGSGSFTKTGVGNLRLTGTSGLTGATTVAAGRLSVNGSLANSAVTVLAGAELGGNGTVGATTVQSGGMLSPGNSIGTLIISGNLVLAPGSTYIAEIAGNGGSDRVIVSGTTTVTGSEVVFTALDPQISYQLGQRYTLIDSSGGVVGAFSRVSSPSAFLDVGLDPRTGAVDLTIKVKDSVPGTPPASDPGTPASDPGTPPAGAPGSTPTAPLVFQTVAATPNQLSTALALNTLPQVGGTLALYNSLLMLDAGSARQAFDLLSGEVHASAKTALVEEGGALRSTAIDRLRSAFGTVGSASMATMSYGFTADLAPAVKGLMPVPRTDRFAVWGQGYGSWGRNEAQGGVAKLTRSTGGLMIGADAAVFDNLRFGLIAGYSHSEFDAKGRLSSGESDNYHLGLYGGGQFGAFGLRTGASYTWHDVSTRRSVTFAGFGDGLTSDYQAATAQVFGELGYRIDLGRAAFEPFAGLAYVNLHTDGFREIGGAAALSGRSDDTSIGYSTLGLRASTNLSVQGMDLTLRGALAWRHALGDVDPAATLAFAGSNAFTVAGVPIATNAALVEAGIDLTISRNATLGVSYTGQLASDAQDHAFKANLAVRF